MNGTTIGAPVTPGTDGGVLSSTPRMSGFGYGVGVSVGILLLITTITLASYFCTRANHEQHLEQRRQHQQLLRLQRHLAGVPSPPFAVGGAADVEAAVGIDDATLASYPTALYAQAKGNEGDGSGGCCPICLADYKETDLLRLLPDCKHQFHVGCVDTWLKRNPSCPVCRTSPLPSPMPTPLAEVVPLASARQ